MSDVAIVIPNWNSLGYLRRCLASLADQDVETETVVVDNGSTDGSPEWLEGRGVSCIRLPRNMGFAPAVNRGVAATTAPLVLVLNADALLVPGCLARLAAAIKADPKLGGVQPLILQAPEEGPGAEGEPLGDPAPEVLIYSAGQALTRDGRAYEIAMGRPLARAAIAPGPVFGVCGAACLFRRSMFEGLGGYDESYFAFYEDVDLNVRARLAGWEFALEAETRAWHVGNAVWRSASARPEAFNARLVARNRLSTQIKFMPLAALPRIAVVEVGSLARAARQRRLLATLKGKLEALAALPRLLRERRRLAAAGDPDRARAWLGRPAR